MLTLEGIRAIASQTFRNTIEGGEIIFKLYFRPTVKMWFIDIEYNDFIVNNVRVCNSPNILEQYSRIIPFGLMISVQEIGYEPSLIDDFTSSRVTLNLLDESELDQIENVFVELKEI